MEEKLGTKAFITVEVEPERKKQAAALAKKRGHKTVTSLVRNLLYRELDGETLKAA